MIIFKEENIIKTSTEELSKKGFLSLGWNTAIKCYRNNQGECVYYDSDKKVFFTNALGTKPVFKVIVAGSRTFDDYALLERKLDNILQNKILEYDIEIVEGDAKGADKAGGLYADRKGYKKTVMPADWNSYGRSAGHRRNEEMARYAIGGGCVVFWDGISRGSKNMIEMAKKYKLKLLIVKF